MNSTITQKQARKLLAIAHPWKAIRRNMNTYSKQTGRYFEIPKWSSRVSSSDLLPFAEWYKELKQVQKRINKRARWNNNVIAAQLFRLYDSRNGRWLDVEMPGDDAKKHLLANRGTNKEIENGRWYFASISGIDTTISIDDLDKSKRVSTWAFLKHG